jgi:hypothetical protein
MPIFHHLYASTIIQTVSNRMLQDIVEREVILVRLERWMISVSSLMTS